MAGQSDKKQRQKKQVKNQYSKIAIVSVTIIYVLINAYSVIINDYKFSRGDTLGFLFLTMVNFGLYRLLDVFESSMFYLPMLDLLIINLLVELLINFHWKFWFLYLVVPGYLLVKGGGYLYEHVKTVGKPQEGDEIPDPRSAQKVNSSKEKKKIVKIK